MSNGEAEKRGESGGEPYDPASAQAVTLATSLNQMALALQQQGRLDEAEGLYRQAIELLRAHGEGMDEVLARCLCNLGVVYRARGDSRSAIPCYEEALSIRERSVRDAETEVAKSAALLAALREEAAGPTPVREPVEADPAVTGPLLEQATQILAGADLVALEEDPEARKSRAWRQAVSLDRMASELAKQGASARAEQLYLRAIDLLRRHGVRPAGLEGLLPGCLDRLAQHLRAAGDALAAVPFCEEALAIRSACLGEIRLAVADGLNDLGMMHEGAGDYPAARPLFERSLAVARDARRSVPGEQAGSADVLVAAVLANLGALHHKMGDLRQAERTLLEALDHRKKTLGEAPSGDLQGTHQLGALYTNLGALYADIGDFRSAKANLVRAVEIFEAMPEVPGAAAAALGNLAELYASAGDPRAALPLARRSLEMRRAQLPEGHPDIALGRLNLGALQVEAGEPGEARSYFEQALRAFEGALGAEHPAVAVALNSLGVLLGDEGRLAEAEALHRRALAIRQKQLGAGHPDVAASLMNLGYTRLLGGDGREAEALTRQAMEILRSCAGEEHPQSLLCLCNLAGLAALDGRPAEAVEMLGRILSLEDRLLQNVFAIGSERRRAAHLLTIESTRDLLLSLVMLHCPADPAAARVALGAVLHRKSLQAEVLSVRRDVVLGGRHPHLAARLRELTALRARIAESLMNGPEGDPEAHRSAVARESARAEALEEELVGEIPEMSLDTTLRSATPEAVAEKLPAGSALVEILRFSLRRQLRPGPASTDEHHYAAVILRHGAPEDVRFVDLGDAEMLDAKIAAFRRALLGRDEAAGARGPDARGPDARGPTGGGWTPVVDRMESPPEKGLVELGEELRRAVLDPVAAVLGSCRRLFVAPDGELCRLPFEVLPAGGGRYVIDDWHVSYLTCGRDALRFGVRLGVEASAPEVIAAPDLELEEVSSARQKSGTGTGTGASWDIRGLLSPFGELPGARREGELVARRLGVSPRMGGDALESVVKGLRSPRILHFATHGFFLPGRAGAGQGEAAEAVPDNPLLRSGLVLAGANTWLRRGDVPPAAQDGILNGEDVASMDLVATELLVLSACQTGLGEIQAGEGVLGLRRAFVAAGARTLVMSLWSVPDDPTQQLMEVFYDRLLCGMGPSEALREAQRRVRERCPHPLAWGGFVCQGEPG